MSDERRGPRLKPALDTAGDIAYSRRRVQLLAAELRRRLEAFESAERDAAYRRSLDATQAAETHDFFWARAWIKQHGGTVAATLKQTHPDTGGNVQDFQFTQKAREILKRQRPT